MLILLCHTLSDIKLKEKRMKRITIISISATLASAIVLSGCNGGDNSGSKSTPKVDITVSGKAIDPYLSGSKVCLDLNRNRVCEVNEPYTTTDSSGHYALKIAKEHHEAHHSLLASGGVDTGTNRPFLGTLTAIKEAHKTIHNITPLTSMIEARYQYCRTHHDKCHESIDEITASLADYLELSNEHINADIVELANSGYDRALKTALALEKSAEFHYREHPYRFYEKIVQSSFSRTHDWQNDIKVSMPKEYDLVKGIMSIDESNLEDTGNVNSATHTRAHQIAKYTYNLSKQIANDAHEISHDTHEDAHDAAEDTNSTVRPTPVPARPTPAPPVPTVPPIVKPILPF